MGLLISIVGPSGVGKTTLARTLAKDGEFELAAEEHIQRPYQVLFKEDPSYAFLNQIDYLIHRADQESGLRKNNRSFLMDGGLDLDFHGFTRLFHQKGWLKDGEYALCERFYLFARTFLPPPDFVISLSASKKAIDQRLAGRDRVNIATSVDAQSIQSFVDAWLATLPGDKVFRLDVTEEDAGYSRSKSLITQWLGKL